MNKTVFNWSLQSSSLPRNIMRTIYRVASNLAILITYLKKFFHFIFQLWKWVHFRNFWFVKWKLKISNNTANSWLQNNNNNNNRVYSRNQLFTKKKDKTSKTKNMLPSHSFKKKNSKNSSTERDSIFRINSQISHLKWFILETLMRHFGK